MTRTMRPVRRANAERWEAYFCVCEIKHFHLAQLRLREKGILFDLGASVFLLVTPHTCECLSTAWARSDDSTDGRWKQTAGPWGVPDLLWPAAITWPCSLFSRAEEGRMVRGGGKRFVSLCPCRTYREVNPPTFIKAVDHYIFFNQGRVQVHSSTNKVADLFT